MAARSGILGLGSRLYPGNMQRIFNKDLTRFMQSLSRERQNRASKRKALLAGWSDAQENKEDEQVKVDDKESEIHQQQESVRRSTRQVRRPARFKDFVIE